MSHPPPGRRESASDEKRSQFKSIRTLSTLAHIFTERLYLKEQIGLHLVLSGVEGGRIPKFLRSLEVLCDPGAKETRPSDSGIRAQSKPKVHPISGPARYLDSLPTTRADHPRAVQDQSDNGGVKQGCGIDEEK